MLERKDLNTCASKVMLSFKAIPNKISNYFVCTFVCVMGIYYLSSFGNTNEKRMLKLQMENTMEL